MQLYILDKDPKKAAEMLPIRLKGKNYAQKMLIELGQCLSNMLGNKDFDGRLYKYKAVPPQFTSFIFHNQRWVLLYYAYLADRCLKGYVGFRDTETWRNYSNIFHLFGKAACYSKNGCLANCLSHAWFIPQKEYGERKYLPIDKCVEEYRRYLEWKNMK